MSKQQIKVSCEVCLKTFKSESLLNSHKTKVHKNTKKTEEFKIKIRKTCTKRKQVRCGECNQEFPSRKELAVHKALHDSVQIEKSIEPCDMPQLPNPEIQDLNENSIPSTSAENACNT